MNSKEVRVFWDKVEKEEKVKGLKNILDDLDYLFIVERTLEHNDYMNEMGKRRRKLLGKKKKEQEEERELSTKMMLRKRKKFTHADSSLETDSSDDYVEESKGNKNKQISKDYVCEENSLREIPSQDTSKDIFKTSNHTPKSGSEKIKKHVDEVREPSTDELILRPPLSLSSSANKKKGFVREMLNIRPKHVRFDADGPVEEMTGTEYAGDADETDLALSGPGRLISTCMNFERKNKYRPSKKKINGDMNNENRKGSGMQPRETLDHDINECDTREEQIEVSRRNYDELQLYSGGHPVVGDTIAYKIMEMSDSYTPEWSDFKEATILGFDMSSNLVTLQVCNNVSANKSRCGKFDLEGIEDYLVEGQDVESETVSVEWAMLADVREIVD